MRWGGLTLKIIVIFVISTIISTTMILSGNASETGHRLERLIEISAHKTLMSRPKELTTFTTDGCSGGMSWLWRRFASDFEVLKDRYGETTPLEYCCVAHDHAYHGIGNATTADESFTARLVADQTLHSCVANHGAGQTRINGYPAIANLMYIAVRLGGTPCSSTPFRWGYGLPDC